MSILPVLFLEMKTIDKLASKTSENTSTTLYGTSSTTEIIGRLNAYEAILLKCKIRLRRDMVVLT